MRHKGYTLIEIIAVLVLLGLLAVFGGQILTTAVRGYVQARSADALVQKAQIALQRMTVEFSYMDPATASGNATLLNYNGGVAINNEHTVSLSGSNLLYAVGGVNYVLLDGLADGGLQFAYYNSYSSGSTTDFDAANTKIIGISLTMNGVAGGAAQQFSTRVTLNKFQ